MYSTISIRNFRGFESLEAVGLRRINLIVGRNNSGTTHNDEMLRSALEAFAGTEGTLGLHRIDKRDNRHVMASYSDEAIEAVREVPFEVRG